MDLQYLLNILSRRKWLILTVMLIAAIATYLFVDRLPPTYKSEASLSTGIIDFKGLNVEDENPFLQKFTVEISFGNLIEFMKSQRNIQLLSYQLLIHDLGRDSINQETPFRSLKDLDEEFDINAYNPSDISRLVNTLKEKSINLESSLGDPQLERLFNELAKAYGYDHETLLKNNLIIERKNETDFIKVQFESEDPKLSTFAVNQYCNEFLRNYSYLQASDDNKNVSYFRQQVKEKKAELDKIQGELDNYRLNKGIVDLEGQRQAIVSQITQLEQEREATAFKVPALKASVAKLNRYLKDIDQKSAGNQAETIIANQAIQNLKRQISELETKYVASNYQDEKTKKLLELYRKNYATQIKRVAELEPRNDEDELNKSDEKLLERRIEKEMELQDAEENLASIDAELIRLRKNKLNLVSSDTYVQTMAQRLELLEKEYLQLTSKESDMTIEMESSSYPVKLVTHAQLPEKPEPDHQIILSAFAGMVSGTMCVVAIFFLTFLDVSLNTPHQFKKFTDVELLASINKIKTKNLDIKNLFETTSTDAKLESFKESMRNLRYIVESSGANKFLFTSTKNQEGKTFCIVNLAHVLTLKNKKVLLIDTNFKSNTLTQMSNTSQEENLLNNSRLIGDNGFDKNFVSSSINATFNLENVDIIGNQGTHQSPSEVFAGKDFKNFIERLENSYDYIFLEAAALNKYSDAKELTDYVDKVITVFAAESEIHQQDRNTIAYLKSLGDKFMGGVLNRVDLKNLS